MTFELQRLANGDTVVSFAGSHDTFPAYELLLNGAVAYEYQIPEDQAGPTIWNLSASTTFTGSFIIHPPVE